MASRFEVGVGPGLRIYFNLDGSAAWRGSSEAEIVLQRAEGFLRSGVCDQERLDFVRRWIQQMNQAIEAAQLERRIEAEAGPRLARAAKLLPEYAVAPAELLIRNQVRQKLEKKSGA